MAREDTIGDHQERITRVVLYIQEHRDEPLTLDVLAEVACFSPFHFHRIFAAYVGETLRGYVRRIRLERAALRLCHTDEAVTEIALAAGYETPGAFNKAFRKHFRESPSSFRKKKRATYFPEQRIVIQSKATEDIMQPDIREFPERKALFVRQTGRYDKAASKAWGKICRFAFMRRLVEPDALFIGISHDDPEITPEDKLRYDACITITQDVKPKGEVGVQTVGGGTYAVFLHKGPYEGLGQVYCEAYGQWLPDSGRKLRDAACFEVYLNDPNRTKPEDLQTEVYLPIE